MNNFLSTPSTSLTCKCAMSLLLYSFLILVLCAGGSQGVRVQSWEQGKRSGLPISLADLAQRNTNDVPLAPRNDVPTFYIARSRTPAEEAVPRENADSAADFLVQNIGAEDMTSERFPSSRRYLRPYMV